MSTINEQIQQIQEKANKEIAKLTAGAEKELLATLTTASESFSALSESRQKELWKEAAFDGILTNLKLQPIKTKAKGKGKKNAGKTVWHAIKKLGGKTKLAELKKAVGDKVTADEFKTATENVKTYKVDGDTITLVKK